MTSALTRRKFLLSTAAAGATLAFGRALAADEQAWDAIREHLFQDQKIVPGDNFIKLIAPTRPPNSADVTVQIASSLPQSAERFVKKHYLVVDENPSPVAGVFTLAPQNGLADVTTRIRVNSYSHVRVISETNDGDLYMNTAFVKASGGCSAAPGKEDPLAKLARGKTTLLDEGETENGAHKFHVSVIHPNYSGLQKDQITLYFIPPHYIESVEVKNQKGEMVFAVNGDITFSENPSFGFHYIPQKSDVLTVKVTDSHKKTFETWWPVTSA